MKKIISIVLVGISLNIIEYLLLYLIFVIEGFILYSEPKAIITESFKEVSELSLTRFIFYFVFWNIIIFFFYDKIKIKNTSLKLAFANCMIYIILSVIMTLFFPFAIDFFTRSFFYYITLTTFCSPFILFSLPYFKKIRKTFQ